MCLIQRTDNEKSLASFHDKHYPIINIVIPSNSGVIVRPCTLGTYGRFYM
jgi:hypothetical protein